MNSIVKILKVEFLTNKKSIGAWKMIVYLSFLGGLMITSGHIMDKKSYQIQELEKQVVILKTELIDLQGQLLEVSKLPPKLELAQTQYIEQSVETPIEIKIENIEL
ncbi:MAG: FtsL-like putative cell division protein [Flavobacteriaceae bacterium]|nr:FtsL-like putative cell division protein [Flavobacteriaceae bacterium]MCY4215557.1 FtsL-like putative cell division protein [Flavobacteriaceae bacterium]MCY4253337.1 FtsL-like putative cell division protein [Flavobacteriaceae bacterium]